MTQKEVEERIIEYFEENYELLRLEGGHALTEESKNYALNQVLNYWRKLQDLAKRVTDTEVKLILPNQQSPKGRSFSIEGIVDIVREEVGTYMYDIKTHDYDYICANIELYQKQLNIYAHIWQELRQNPLNHTAVISTSIPNSLKAAEQAKDQIRINKELELWNPIIDIPLSNENIEETIEDFGRVVDLIEGNQFGPAEVDKLKEPITGKTNVLFVTRVCRNCDARFSCESFREYVQTRGGKSASTFKKYFEDLADDIDQEDWVNANLVNKIIPESIEVITD